MTIENTARIGMFAKAIKLVVIRLFRDSLLIKACLKDTIKNINDIRTKAPIIPIVTRIKVSSQTPLNTSTLNKKKKKDNIDITNISTRNIQILILLYLSAIIIYTIKNQI